MSRILVAQPNETVAKRICDLLAREGHTVRLLKEGHEKQVEAFAPEAVVLDAQVKWTVCRPIFQTLKGLDCPVLFLTQDRQMTSHLRALYQGRSDVQLMPYTQHALLGKLSRLMEKQPTPGELKLDEEERVALLDGQRVELTAQEFALLLALMQSPDAPISREQLLRTAWGYQSMGDTRTVDVHVQRLRKKLGCERIETVYKCGYRLVMA